MIKKFAIVLITTVALTFNVNAGSDGELILKKNNPAEIKDCSEGFNRASFALNQGLDKAFIKPLAEGYRNLPDPIQRGTSNAVKNLSTLITIPETVNAHQFAQLMEENGLGAENEMPEYLDYDTTRQRVFNRITGEDFDGVDWYRTAYKDWTPQTQHNLSARGRSNKIGYFI